MPEPDAGKGFGRLIRSIQAEERLPSISSAVFREGEVAWSEAVGLADTATEEEATPDHQYRIGSITKTFTAVCIMQLRDAGELELDDPLDRHIPEGPRGPTLRRLLSHLSGLQREIPGEIWESMESPTREELLAELAGVEQVLAPGRLWHYSNLGFALLGEIVARRSGTPYEHYVRERLLEPLGLTRTTWQAAPPVAKGYFVHPYMEQTILERYDVDLRGGSAAGALWSTAADLCRWGMFLADPDPAILAAETVEEMRSLQVMADPQGWTLGWGLGLMLFRRGDRVLVGHNGGMPGHVAHLSVAPKERVGSATLIASTAPGKEVVRAVLGLTEKAVETFPAAPSVWRPEAPPPAEIEPLLGRWWSEGGEFVFSYRAGMLEARIATAPRELEPTVFEPDGADRFRARSGLEAGELLRVVRDDHDEVVKLYWATYPFTRSPQVFGS